MTAEASAAFAAYERNARNQFLLHLYAAVYWLINNLRRLGMSPDALIKAHPFLEVYFTAALRHMPADLSWEAALAWWEAALAWWEAAIREWEATPHPHPHKERGGLSRIRAHPRLLFQQRLAFVLSGLPEIDSRFGALFAQLQAPLPTRRPSLELIQRVIKAGAAANDPDVDDLGLYLMRAGYLTLHNPDDSRAEWVVSAPPALWDIAQGRSPDALGLQLHSAPFPLPETLILPPSLIRRLQQIAHMQQVAPTTTLLVLRGSAGEAFPQVAGALATAAGAGLIEVRPKRSGSEFASDPLSTLGALCTMTGAIPLLHYDLAPGESIPVPLLRGYDGLIVLALGKEGGLQPSSVPLPILALDLPLPDVEGRAQLWARALDGHAIEAVDSLAATFRYSAGTITALAPSVIASAAADGRLTAHGATITLDDVREAARHLNRQRLDALATAVETEAGLSQLVVSADTEGRLVELMQRCRHRERLHAHLGVAFAGGDHAGVRALFVGVSGTGKTLAARLLAAELGKDLYRVNLAAVVNKYIGETEKNLHAILTQAEALDVILLLDEGDALLGTRTDIRSSNDRYANLETNFLLQRLEQYQGIAIITTNAANTIDSAFQRRMDVIVRFDPPQTEERRRIWELHLPADHEIEPGYLAAISAQCVLTGAQIRNVALHTALLAVDEGCVVGQSHLARALRGEYQKAGAVFPLGISVSGGASMSQFLESIGAEASSERRNGNGVAYHER